MTERDLQEIENRVNAATEGPWRTGHPRFRCTLDHGRGPGGHGGKDCRYTFVGWTEDLSSIYQAEAFTSQSDIGVEQMVVGMWDYEEGGVRLESDADFIAHARTDVPRLLAEVRRLRALVADHPGPLFDPEDFDP